MIGMAREAMKTQQLHQVLNAVWAVVAEANRYFAGEAPWALAKTDPPRQRTVLVLRYYNDLSEAEIASVLRCSVGTVKSQVSRGLARLREVVTVPDAESAKGQMWRSSLP